MAGQSRKKETMERQSEMRKIMYYILGINFLLILSYLYSIFFKGYEIGNFDVISAVVLNVINLVCYRMLDVFYKSMFYDYINDVFIINLAVNLFLAFTKKAWYIYLLIPGYLCYKVGMYAYLHVKNLDKSNNEAENEAAPKQQKSKILKYNR